MWPYLGNQLPASDTTRTFFADALFLVRFYGRIVDKTTLSIPSQRWLRYNATFFVKTFIIALPKTENYHTHVICDGPP